MREPRELGRAWKSLGSLGEHGGAWGIVGGRFLLLWFSLVLLGLSGEPAGAWDSLASQLFLRFHWFSLVFIGLSEEPGGAWGI